uniref:Uncharacterized protein n=1 Tax=Anopheles atroparvus TaxID=41427 RepID=A0AAG5DLL8_ANOAO
PSVLSKPAVWVRKIYGPLLVRPTNDRLRSIRSLDQRTETSSTQCSNRPATAAAVRFPVKHSPEIVAKEDWHTLQPTSYILLPGSTLSHTDSTVTCDVGVFLERFAKQRPSGW